VVPVFRIEFYDALGRWHEDKTIASTRLALIRDREVYLNSEQNGAPTVFQATHGITQHRRSVAWGGDVTTTLARE
jgi:hypothetical protein